VLAGPAAWQDARILTLRASSRPLASPPAAQFRYVTFPAATVASRVTGRRTVAFASERDGISRVMGEE